MAITNSTIAQAVNDLVDYWDSFNVEYAAWLTGVVGGGPNLDGEYPLTDYLGNVTLTLCPAALEASVTGVVDSASTYATAAQAAQTAAEAAQTAAELAETNSDVSEAQALAYRDAALAAQTAAESARTTAIAQAAAALVSANSAAADAALTAADAISTAADAVLTAADVTYSAEWANKAHGVLVSAAAGGDQVDDYSALHWATEAATFNPALYALVGHVHEGTEIDATGITDGYVLTADGAGNAAWEAGAVPGDFAELTTTTQSDTYLYLNRNSTSPALHVATMGAGPSGKFGAVPSLGSTAYTDYVELGKVGNHVVMSGPAPKLKWIETDATADNGWWDSVVAAEQLRFRLLNDADAASNDWLTVDRTGITNPIMKFGGQVQIEGYVDQDVMLYFAMDRPWRFMSDGEDANNRLELNSVNSKSLIITDGAGATQFTLATSSGNLTVAGAINGYNLSSAATGPPGASQIVKTHTNGYTYLGWINTTSGSTTTDPARIYCSNDAFLRYMTPDSFIDFLEGEDWNFNLSGGVEMNYGITGDYASSGSTFGCTIWSIGPAYAVTASGAGSSNSNVYGIRWLRSTHASALSTTGEGLYTMTNGTVRSAIGVNGVTVPSTGDITKTSHGNYLYHQSTAYDNDQNGGITFSTSTRTGGTTGDIWFKYT